MIKLSEKTIQKKISFKLSLKKYVEFKARAANRHRWENGYTSKAVNEAIELWLIFDEMPEDMREKHLAMLKLIHQGQVRKHSHPSVSMNLSPV